MKSVLIGADILKLQDGYKLLEINTNISLVSPFTTYFDFDGLMLFCNLNSLSEIIFIYTEKNKEKFSRQISRNRY